MNDSLLAEAVGPPLFHLVDAGAAVFGLGVGTPRAPVVREAFVALLQVAADGKHWSQGHDRPVRHQRCRINVHSRVEIDVNC